MTNTFLRHLYAWACATTLDKDQVKQKFISCFRCNNNLGS